MIASRTLHRPAAFVKTLWDASAGLQKTLYAIQFIGECVEACKRLLQGKSQMRSVDYWSLVAECGAQALPIVSLISLLTGLIMAFVGMVQLKQFGAEIYVANLVGLAMVREMGALMVAMIISGRSGAAFAAHLGSMRVSEEIDALRTMAISPMDFLVLPRVLALVAMMPLLCLYADFLGICGGMVVSAALMDNINISQYLRQTEHALEATDLCVGLIKSVAFGWIIALTGCMTGLNAGRNATAVGQAATRAVVRAITGLVICDAGFAWFFNRVGL